MRGGVLCPERGRESPQLGVNVPQLTHCSRLSTARCHDVRGPSIAPGQRASPGSAAEGLVASRGIEERHAFAAALGLALLASGLNPEGARR